MAVARPYRIEPIVPIVVGLLLARAVFAGSKLSALDYVIAIVIFVGGLGWPLASRRRWWLMAFGIVALVTVIVRGILSNTQVA